MTPVANVIPKQDASIRLFRWGARFSAVMGLIVTVLSFFFIIVIWNMAIHNPGSLSSSESVVKWIFPVNLSDFFGYRFIILLLIFGYLTQSFFFACGLIRFSLQPDSEFVSNKWALVLFSVGLGGIFCPAILTRLPNMDTTATRVVDLTLVRYIGVALATTLGIFAFILISFGHAVPNNGDTNVSRLWGCFAGLLLSSALVAVSIVPFFRENVDLLLYSENKNQQPEATTLTQYLRTIIIFYRVIATIMLVLVMIWYTLSLLFEILYDRERLKNLRQGNSFFYVMFAFMMVLSIFTKIALLIFRFYLVSATIKGLWADNNGLIAYQTNERYAEHRAIRARRASQTRKRGLFSL